MTGKTNRSSSGVRMMTKSEPKIRDIARVVHEANRAFCISLGDMSQVAWDDAPEWQRNSAIDGVLFVLGNPEADQSATHQNWMKVKKREGWVYGEVKDAEKKTHPCMVPYEELPPDQQLKDALFHAIVHAFRAHTLEKP